MEKSNRIKEIKSRMSAILVRQKELHDNSECDEYNENIVEYDDLEFELETLI